MTRGNNRPGSEFDATSTEGEQPSVSPSHSSIRKTVEAYLALHPEEHDTLAGLLPALDRPDNATSRTTLPGHITCSAVVIDRGRRVLHIRHQATGLLLAPGGHVEPEDRSLLAAALREVAEEAGIQPGSLCLTPQALGSPIDIDVHDIDPSPGKGEPGHQYYDFRFAFYLADEQAPALTLQDQEVSGAQWLNLTEVTAPTLRAKLVAGQFDGKPEPVNASVLLHDGHGNYLLHLRDQVDNIWEPGAWALLGGGRTAADPSLEATLRRELAEEAPGLTATGLTPYAVEEATSIDGFAVPIQVYTGLWSGHPDTADLREGVLLNWFTVDTLDRLNLTPGLGDLIRRHAAEHPAVDGPPVDGRLRPGEASKGTKLHIVGVQLYIRDEHGRILLGLRHPNSAFAPSTWHLLAGHAEQESAVSCLVREAKEEAGLDIARADVELVHTIHLVDYPGARPRIGLLFEARSWTGIPRILEANRCVEWRWWDPKALPKEIVPYARQAIDGIVQGRTYSEMGWAEQ